MLINGSGSAAPSELPEWRVVIVDDSPDERADARRLLLRSSDRRYVFCEADTGSAGVRAVLDPVTGPPNCLLLDYDLPDMEAPEVLDALRGPDGILVCPVVVFTGHVGLEAGPALLRAGAQDYIGKDWLKGPALTRVLENAVERWSMARELKLRAATLEASEVNYRMLFQAAREGETRLRMTLEATNTGIWTWEFGTDCVNWSPGYAIQGLAQEDFTGSGASFLQLIHPHDRERVQRTLQTAVANQSLCQCAFRVLRPSGQVVSVETLGRASYGGAGDPLRMIGTVTDVSARNRVEDELKRSEERLARAQRAARIGTWDWNVRTGEASWTEETWRLLGLSPFSCPSTYDLWLSCVHPDDREAADATVREAFRTGSYRHEFRVSHAEPDAAIRWLESSGEALSDANGQPARMLGTVRDSTERHEAERALRTALDHAEQAVSSRDQLLALVSHDLKNPLGALMLGVELLRGQLGARVQAVGPSGLSTLDKLDKQILRMDKLVDELLDAARLHAGKPLDLELAETNLVQLTLGLVIEHQRIAPRHRIEVRASRDVIMGRWDARRIERVVSNLLSNAVKYSPDGGKVQVDLGEEQAGNRTLAVLRIEDSGIGIALNERAMVFEWFTRGENARRSDIEGTGIGLAGAREIVTRHGGTISVDSDVGRGSIFTVRLPVQPPEAAVPKVWAVSAPKERASPSRAHLPPAR